MDGLETSEAKAEDKGESAEAAAEIEADGRRKEIADEAFVQLCAEAERQKQGLMIVDINEWSRLKSRDHFFIIKRWRVNQRTSGFLR